MDREEALRLLREHVRTSNLIKHCLATEAIMRALARRLGEPEDRWAVAGLLHDLDFEATRERSDRHGLEAERVLRQEGLDEDIILAIKAHNAAALGLERSTPFEHALAAAETLTGLIVATALVYPDKRLRSVKASSVLKRMKRKDFARSVNRDIIRECERFGMALPDFVALSLEAMQGIADDLGL